MIKIDKIIDLVKNDNDDLYKIASGIINDDQHLEKTAISRYKKEYLFASPESQQQMLSSGLVKSEGDYAKKLSETGYRIMRDAASAADASLLHLPTIDNTLAKAINIALSRMGGGGAALQIPASGVNSFLELVKRLPEPLQRKWVQEFIDELKPGKPALVYAGPVGDKSMSDAVTKMHEAYEIQGLSKGIREGKNIVPAKQLVARMTPSEKVEMISRIIEESGENVPGLFRLINKVYYKPQKIILEKLENLGVMPPINVTVGRHAGPEVLHKEKNLLKNLVNYYPDISERVRVFPYRGITREYEFANKMIEPDLLPSLESRLADMFDKSRASYETERAKQISDLMGKRKEKLKNLVESIAENPTVKQITQKAKPTISTLASKAKKLMSRFVK